ncbi:hypothetical protein GCM10010174_35240 [Kutzneria viridogrisea]
MLHEGALVADTLVLSHEEQLHRLAAAVPEATGSAVVAGDPCYDRILASTTRRGIFREALGCTDDTRLIVTTSTWRQGSAFGAWPTMLRQLMAELSPVHHRVAAILHPHVWHQHSPWQVRTWLADCLRAGLVLIPPLEGWRAALIAADVVVGDHGAVTCYAAAMGKPVVLAAFDEDEVVAGTSVALLGELAPRLDPHQPLLPQLDVTSGYEPVRELVTSFPFRAAELHRELFYRKLGLSEPDSHLVQPLLPSDGLSPGSGPQALLVSGTAERLRLRAADVRPAMTGDCFLAVHTDHPVRSLRTNADVLFGTVSDEELAGVLDRTPSSLIAVSETTGVALVRGHSPVRILGNDRVVGACALHAWLSAHPNDLPATLDVDVNGRAYRFALPSLR